MHPHADARCTTTPGSSATTCVRRGPCVAAIAGGVLPMDVPSPARIMVELQKGVTRGHRLLLQSPLAPLVSTTPWGRFLILHTTGRRSGQTRTTPLSYTKDGDGYVVIASDGGS